MRRLALLLAVALAATPIAAIISPAFAAPGERVSYRPPVDGPIVDPWRPPGEPWSAGNRGVDYATQPGTPVRSAADGEVVFASQVGGELHVVVLHPDGIRTSYSFLESIAVHRGDVVKQGQVVGTSGHTVHFGARVGDTYIDPTSLFDNGPPKVYLVPDEVRRPQSEAKERSALARFVSAVRRAGATAARTTGRVGQAAAGTAVGLGSELGGWAAGVAVSNASDRWNELKGVVHWGKERLPATHALRFGRTALDWWRQQSDCTPRGVPPPPIRERRVAVLVGGLGSNSEDDSIDDVDAPALGYAPSDVLRFSYLGGSTDESQYGPEDTTADIRHSARRLRELLERVERDNPGVPVDIIAHSQGGIVARTFLAYEYASADPRLPEVAHLVTLASPHRGADVATGLAMVGHTASGDFLEQLVSGIGLTSFDLQGESVGQLAETSSFLRRLNRRPLPAGVRATSIGGRGDLTVPAIHTALAGARNVVVSPPGAWGDHAGLPGSEAGRRELALALADLPPTCQTLGDMLTDTLVSDVITLAEDAAGASLWAGGRWIDDKTKGALILLGRKDP